MQATYEEIEPQAVGLVQPGLARRAHAVARQSQGKVLQRNCSEAAWQRLRMLISRAVFQWKLYIVMARWVFQQDFKERGTYS